MNNLKFTDAALDRIQNLLENPENKDSYLRIYIVGGGCSGFQYGFKFEQINSCQNFENSNEEIDEITFEKYHPKYPNKNPLKIVVDALSFQYLEGATIDFIENLKGACFKVDNPHAETTCGCGSSFSLKEKNSDF